MCEKKESLEYGIPYLGEAYLGLPHIIFLVKTEFLFFDGAVAQRYITHHFGVAVTYPRFLGSDFDVLFLELLEELSLLIVAQFVTFLKFHGFGKKFLFSLGQFSEEGFNSLLGVTVIFVQVGNRAVTCA